MRGRERRGRGASAPPPLDRAPEGAEEPTQGVSEESPASPEPQGRYPHRSGSHRERAAVRSPQSRVRPPLAKRAKTSGPGETSRPSTDLPTPPGDTTIPSDLSPGSIIRRPMIAAEPIQGNSDCRSRPFHEEAYFDHQIFRALPELSDSYSLLQRYWLEPFMTPREFFYPRVAMEFFQTMTTRGAPGFTSIQFSIDGRQGELETRHIADAFQIPYEPEDQSVFR